MRTFSRNKTVAAVVAIAALGGGGAAVAANGLSGSPEHQAIIKDAAAQLNVDPAKLDAALTQAQIDQIDAAVKSGALTQAQADEIKTRIKNGDSGALGGLGFGGGHHGHDGFGFGGHDSLEAAAVAYLGVTEADVHAARDKGQSLAQIAKDKGKDVAGLKDAITAALTKDLDAAVTAGKLTKAQETQMLSGASAMIDNEINDTHPGRNDGGGFDGHGPGDDDGPVAPSTTPVTPTPATSGSGA